MVAAQVLEPGAGVSEASQATVLGAPSTGCRTSTPSPSAIRCGASRSNRAGASSGSPSSGAPVGGQDRGGLAENLAQYPQRRGQRLRPGAERPERAGERAGTLDLGRADRDDQTVQQVDHVRRDGGDHGQAEPIGDPHGGQQWRGVGRDQQRRGTAGLRPPNKRLEPVDGRDRGGRADDEMTCTRPELATGVPAEVVDRAIEPARPGKHRRSVEHGMRDEIANAARSRAGSETGGRGDEARAERCGAAGELPGSAGPRGAARAGRAGAARRGTRSGEGRRGAARAVWSGEGRRGAARAGRRGGSAGGEGRPGARESGVRRAVHV